MKLCENQDGRTPSLRKSTEWRFFWRPTEEDKETLCQYQSQEVAEHFVYMQILKRNKYSKRQQMNQNFPNAYFFFFIIV